MTNKAFYLALLAIVFASALITDASVLISGATI